MNETQSLLPKYPSYNDKRVMLREQQNALLVQLHLRILLALLGTFIVTMTLLILQFTWLSAIPLFVIFIPVWCGHILSVGIYVELCRRLYKSCVVPLPPGARRGRMRFTFIIEEEMIPIVHRFLTVGLWLLLASALLVAFEVMLYERLQTGNMMLTASIISSPLLIGFSLFFLLFVVCRGQGWVAILVSLLLLAGMVMIDLAIDTQNLDHTMSFEYVLIPFWAALALMVYALLRVCFLSACHVFFLTPLQIWAMAGYLAGMAGFGVGMFVLGACRGSCNTDQKLWIACGFLAGMLFVFGSLYIATSQQVQYTLKKRMPESTPLRLSRGAAGWEVDRSKGYYSSFLIGIVRYDQSSLSISEGCLPACVWKMLCCDFAGFINGMNADDESNRSIDF